MLNKQPHWDIYKWPSEPHSGAGARVEAAGLSVQECENALRKIDQLQDSLTREKRKPSVSANTAQQISQLRGQNDRLQGELAMMNKPVSAQAQQAQQAQLAQEAQLHRRAISLRRELDDATARIPAFRTEIQRLQTKLQESELQRQQLTSRLREGVQDADIKNTLRRQTNIIATLETELRKIRQTEEQLNQAVSVATRRATDVDLMLQERDTRIANLSRHVNVLSSEKGELQKCRQRMEQAQQDAERARKSCSANLDACKNQSGIALRACQGRVATLNDQIRRHEKDARERSAVVTETRRALQAKDAQFREQIYGRQVGAEADTARIAQLERSVREQERVIVVSKASAASAMDRLKAEHVKQIIILKREIVLLKARMAKNDEGYKMQLERLRAVNAALHGERERMGVALSARERELDERTQALRRQVEINRRASVAAAQELARVQADHKAKSEDTTRQIVNLTGDKKEIEQFLQKRRELETANAQLRAIVQESEMTKQRAEELHAQAQEENARTKKDAENAAAMYARTVDDLQRRVSSLTNTLADTTRKCAEQAEKCRKDAERIDKDHKRDRDGLDEAKRKREQTEVGVRDTQRALQEAIASSRLADQDVERLKREISGVQFTVQSQHGELERKTQHIRAQAEAVASSERDVSDRDAQIRRLRNNLARAQEEQEVDMSERQKRQLADLRSQLMESQTEAANLKSAANIANATAQAKHDQLQRQLTEERSMSGQNERNAQAAKLQAEAAANQLVAFEQKTRTAERDLASAQSGQQAAKNNATEAERRAQSTSDHIQAQARDFEEKLDAMSRSGKQALLVEQRKFGEARRAHDGVVAELGARINKLQSENTVGAKTLRVQLEELRNVGQARNDAEQKYENASLRLMQVGVAEKRLESESSRIEQQRQQAIEEMKQREAKIAAEVDRVQAEYAQTVRTLEARIKNLESGIGAANTENEELAARSSQELREQMEKTNTAVQDLDESARESQQQSEAQMEQIGDQKARILELQTQVAESVTIEQRDALHSDIEEVKERLNEERGKFASEQQKVERQRAELEKMRSKNEQLQQQVNAASESNVAMDALRADLARVQKEAQAATRAKATEEKENKQLALKMKELPLVESEPEPRPLAPMRKRKRQLEAVKPELRPFEAIKPKSRPVVVPIRRKQMALKPNRFELKEAKESEDLDELELPQRLRVHTEDVQSKIKRRRLEAPQPRRKIPIEDLPPLPDDTELPQRLRELQPESRSKVQPEPQLGDEATVRSYHAPTSRNWWW